jgi:hypothetical protein
MSASEAIFIMVKMLVFEAISSLDEVGLGV